MQPRTDGSQLRILKTRLNEFQLFKTKRIKGYSYASVILENMKKKYLCSFN